MRFNNKDFDKTTNMLRNFFRDIKGYKEVHTQNELSILACEIHKQLLLTIITVNFTLLHNRTMWLENYLLTYPEKKVTFVYQHLIEMNLIQ